MPTAARPSTESSSHWYFPDGKACYEVPYKDPTKGYRNTTLADARKLGLLPSSTTILKILDKPALTSWKVETACLAVLTSPRAAGEEIDAFVKRVLQVDREHEAEASKARELGTQIHDGIEKCLSSHVYDPKLMDYVLPVVDKVNSFGRVMETEKILVGDGYAGKTDCISENDTIITVFDFKTTKNLPKESYPEAKLQLASYAAAIGNTGDKQVQTCNIYISTTEPGKIISFIHQDWQQTFKNGFVPLLKVWSWMNDFNIHLE